MYLKRGGSVPEPLKTKAWGWVTFTEGTMLPPSGVFKLLQDPLANTFITTTILSHGDGCINYNTYKYIFNKHVNTVVGVMLYIYVVSVCRLLYLMLECNCCNFMLVLVSILEISQVDILNAT